ncbi:MAG: AsmA-like C-terminal domain-containing protein [Thermodesulfobacteriota bacterium]
MRPRYLALLCLALLLGLFAVAAPRLVKVEDIETRLVHEAEKGLDAEIAVERIRWRWGPLPHLTLLNTRIVHREYSLRLPKSRIYPSWRALLSGKVAVGGISLLSPEATITTSLADTHQGLPLLTSLPEIRVTNGALQLSPSPSGPFPIRPASLSAIDCTVRRQAGHLTFSLTARSSFAAAVSLSGALDLDTLAYAGTLESKGFELKQLVATEGPLFRPLPSRVDFTCDIRGQGSESGQLLFAGGIPSFALQRLDEAVSFDFDKASLLLEKNGADLSARIYELHLREPDLSFSGSVSRIEPAGSPTPEYRLDLASGAINLNDIRQRLLALLGDNETTALVCDIVRGGGAKSAHYRFAAPLAAFADISAMTIAVDVDRADIHVPEVDLDLSQSSGPILIDKGVISGSGLTSRLGNHYGSNGSFALGLADDNHLFRLDLDIDADLAELPATLHHLIHHDLFRKEVLKFSASGRRLGHLTIGDDLRDFTVDVRIPDLAGAEVVYERLDAPVRFAGGMLHITDKKIEWRQVAGKTGPHRIDNCSGALSWDDPLIPFAVKELGAELDAETLHRQLAAYPVIADDLLRDLSSVAGTISIESGTASGPLLSPSTWRYQLAGAVREMTITAAGLPEKLVIAEAAVTLDENTVAFSSGTMTMLAGEFTFAAGLIHRLLHQWQGWLELSGILSSEAGAWLEQSGRIPDPFFPKTPCELKKMKVSLSDDELTVAGGVGNTTLDGKPVEAVLDIVFRDGRHQTTSLHFFRYPEDGRITISGDGRDQAPLISFQGALNRQTVAAIFSSPSLLDGHLEGFFRMQLPRGEKQGFSLEGRIEARNLAWLWGDQLRQLQISRLSLEGNGDQLTLHDMEVLFAEERANVQGTVRIGPDEISTDLALSAVSLSQETISRFIDDLSVTLKKKKKEQAAGAEGESGSRKLTGTIALRADEFLFTETVKEKKGRRYRLTPLAGTFDFSGSDAVTLQLEEANFCGLEIDGSLQWGRERSSKKFFLKNPAGGQPLLEEVIACAGVEHEIITGPFQVTAELTDENGTLTAGSFHLTAAGGVLKRMTLLSKIFTLVNFTDLYQGLFSTGFNYKLLAIDGHVADNRLLLDRAVMEGEGMDIMAQGAINLHSLDTDLTVYIVPFKSIDKLINIVPLIGRIIGGKKRHILTYPVRVTGNLKEAEITVLSPSALGKAAVDFLFDTLTLPFELLPDYPAPEKDGGIDDNPAANPQPDQ